MLLYDVKKTKKRMKKETKIYVDTEHNGIPEGSCIEVKSENETSYDGIWISDAGSYQITAEKKICRTIPQKVWLKEDYEGIPYGSCIHIEKETQNEYEGTWSSMGGSCNVSIPKNICETR